MSEQPNRPPRTVGIADHLWDALALMSREMGVDRDGLLNQAVFTYARLHGYVLPGTSAGLSEGAFGTAVAGPYPGPVAAGFAPSAAPLGLPTPAPMPFPVAAPAPAFAAYADVPARYDDTPASGVPIVAEPPLAVHDLPSGLAEGTPALPAGLVRTKPSLTPLAAPFAPPAPAPAPGPSPDLGGRLNPEEVRAAQERVLQKAAELERMVRGGGSPDSGEGVDDALLGGRAEEIPVEDGTPSLPAARAQGGGTLVLYAEGREVDRVIGPRFLIGRGKHCDLIINSGKVSREHAAIIREGDGYFMEDLGSSNGTWFDKKRITRRRVEEGDEYFICSERLTCRFE